MLDITEINDTIQELESSNITFDICNKLASLYIIQDRLRKAEFDTVETELNDILPQYQLYCTVKRKYQLNELTENAVYLAMNDVCTEIKEFIQTLYSNTDTPQERDMIKKLIKELYEAF